MLPAVLKSLYFFFYLDFLQGNYEPHIDFLQGNSCLKDSDKDSSGATIQEKFSTVAYSAGLLPFELPWVMKRADKLYAYADLRFSADTRDEAASVLQTRAEKLMADQERLLVS